MSFYDCIQEIEKRAGIMDIIRRKMPGAVAETFSTPSFKDQLIGNTKGMASKMLPALGLMGAAYAVPYGIASAKENARIKDDEGDLEDSYQKMFEKLPQLKEVIDRDGNDSRLRENFDILANMAPDVAKTPSMAAAFVHSAMARGPELFTTGTVKDMVGIQSQLNMARREQPYHQSTGIPGIITGAARMR